MRMHIRRFSKRVYVAHTRNVFNDYHCFKGILQSILVLQRMYGWYACDLISIWICGGNLLPSQILYVFNEPHESPHQSSLFLRSVHHTVGGGSSSLSATQRKVVFIASNNCFRIVDCSFFISFARRRAQELHHRERYAVDVINMHQLYYCDYHFTTR